MSAPTITNLPSIPSPGDANFETLAVALLTAFKNVFVGEVNSFGDYLNGGTWLTESILPISRGGTGANTFVSGRIPFYNGSNLYSSDLYYDGTNYGFGTDTPGSKISVYGGSGLGYFLDQTNVTDFLILGASGKTCIGTVAGTSLCLQTGFTDRVVIDTSGNISPATDNTQKLGSLPNRFSEVYAGIGSINTSDAREKTEVRDFTADEIAAAKILSKEIGIFKFLESINKKGDSARSHIGLTVQRAIDIMESCNLDPFSYGFICYDKWERKVIEHPEILECDAQEAVLPIVSSLDGSVLIPGIPAKQYQPYVSAWTEVVREAGDLYAFRYDQLTLFIIKGIEARLTALEEL